MGGPLSLRSADAALSLRLAACLARTLASIRSTHTGSRRISTIPRDGMRYNTHTMSLPTELVTIYASAGVTATVYAIVLHLIRHVYTPHYTWLTVVGGVALTGLHFIWLYRAGFVPKVAALHFVGLFSATGVPVIVWQSYLFVQSWRKKRTHDAYRRSTDEGRAHARQSAD